jgi:hypothetical protein
MSAKEGVDSAKVSPKDIRRKCRTILNYVTDALTKARSGFFACTATARAVVRTIVDIKEFIETNSSSDDELLKPILEEVRAFLDDFKKGKFSAEFSIILERAGEPMTWTLLD